MVSQSTIRFDFGERAQGWQKYYYMANFEDPAVYHHSQQCEEGKRIAVEPRSRVDTDYVPSDRRPCDEC